MFEAASHEEFDSIITFLSANRSKQVDEVLPAVRAMCDAMRDDNPTLSADKPVVDIGVNRDQIHARILEVFQQERNVQLHSAGRARSCDDTKKFQVYCAISKRREPRAGRYFFWYTVPDKPMKFLRGAKDGYLLFGMEGESKALVMSIREFDALRGKLNPHYSRDEAQRSVNGWHVHVHKFNGRYLLKLRGRGQRHDLSENLLDLS